MKKVLLFTVLVLNFIVAYAAAPTIQASGINFPEVGCNAFEIDFTKGNGTGRIVAIYPGVITTPSGAYTANQIYSSGAAIGGGRVVYNGTGNSVIAVGLAANTTYTVVVYEYNAGNAYLTTTTNSVTVTTDATCTECPLMTGAIINSCNVDNTNSGTCPSGCGEGDAEILFFTSGSYGFVLKSSTNGAPTNNGSIPFMNYFSSGSNNIADAESFVSNASMTTTLNGFTGCTSAFIDASTTGVPPWSTVMMVSSTFCPTNYTLTSICSSFSPIYVIYVDPSVSTWAGQNNNPCSTGNFSNGAGALRYFNIDFSKISTYDGGASSASCNNFYSYNWSSSNDGDGIYFTGNSAGTTSATATAAAGKSTGACNLPIVLPVQLLNFEAVKSIEKNIDINWITLSEANNDYFEVEYSLDAVNFTSYTKVKGAGNSHSKKNYNCVFTESTGNYNIYFRLKQVDFNGNYKYSNAITISNATLDKTDLLAYNNTVSNKIVSRFHLEYPQEVNISLFNMTGAQIEETGSLWFTEGDNEIMLNAPREAGLYLLIFETADGLNIHKKVIVH